VWQQWTGSRGRPFAEELGFKLIEASLSPEVQTALMNSPCPIVPTNFFGPFPAAPLRQAVRRQPQARIQRASPGNRAMKAALTRDPHLGLGRALRTPQDMRDQNWVYHGQDRFTGPSRRSSAETASAVRKVR
jgi:hypothetical protein